MPTNDVAEEIVRQYLTSNEITSIADFVEKHVDYITQNTPSNKSLNKYWPSIIQQEANILKKTLTKSRVRWKKLFGKLSRSGAIISSPTGNSNSNNSISTTHPTNNNNAASPSSSSSPSSHPSSPSSRSSSLPTLKTRITEKDKEVLRERFKKFAEAHKENFWYLDSTKAQAEKDQTSLLSVEEKVMNFALECNFYHPSQSLILDLSDKNWMKVFTEAELKEIEKEGGQLECSEPEELRCYYSDLRKVKTSVDVYKYARTIEINDSSAEHLKVWLSRELQNIAHLFFKSCSFNIADMPETDQQYLSFGFLNTIFLGSDIVAKGTEISSKANTNAVNASRQLSSINAITNRKMGRRGDTVYVYGSREVGCCEVGATKDQTKEFHDCSLKMPLVLRDMLLALTYDSSLLHKSHVIGYSISGGCASLLDVNVPAGYITRVRKTDPLDFPHSDSNLVSSLLPLFTLAYNGKKNCR
ncbi:hypothetical protein BDA99DRAFT_479143 [Phascolomyces articulosus]|uniref:Uncharacterized protein n=1 Tax=Phascolomyces articulosus TaxID=60185 RepID=A0AAD5K521_9FUNG|nr:hypothetical protein BDA99DRAFT_479143 [Phascolomyces articulosus]